MKTPYVIVIALTLGLSSRLPAMIGGFLHGCGGIILRATGREIPFPLLLSATRREIREALVDTQNLLGLYDRATVSAPDLLISAYPMQETLADLRLVVGALLRLLERFGHSDPSQREIILTSLKRLETSDKALATVARLYATAKKLVPRQNDPEWNSDLVLFQQYRRDLRLQLMRYRHTLAYFTQRERTRWLIVIKRDTIECLPQISSHFDEWMDRFYGGPGELDEEDKTLNDLERRAVDILLDTGALVVALPESRVQGERTADVRVIRDGEGHTVEVKVLDPGADDTRVRNRVNDSLKSGGQSNRILLDARHSGLTFDDAFKGARRVGGSVRVNGYVDRLAELRIVGADYDAIFTFIGEEAFRAQLARQAQSAEFQRTMDERLQVVRDRLTFEAAAEILTPSPR